VGDRITSIGADDQIRINVHASPSGGFSPAPPTTRSPSKKKIDNFVLHAKARMTEALSL